MEITYAANSLTDWGTVRFSRRNRFLAVLCRREEGSFGSPATTGLIAPASDHKYQALRAMRSAGDIGVLAENLL
jgi:hypothetical protein